MAEGLLQAGRSAGLEWAVCSSAYPGQQRSGDAFLVQDTRGGALVAVVDALGHGEEAADVADLALASLRETAGQPLSACVTACHTALGGSRGAVMALAAVDQAEGMLMWVAVGNVEAAIVGGGPGAGSGRRGSVPQRGGVVGGRLPPLRQSSVPFLSTDTLIAATDGLATTFLDRVDASLPAPALARRLHQGHAKNDDDALVLVARQERGIRR